MLTRGPRWHVSKICFALAICLAFLEIAEAQEPAASGATEKTSAEESRKSKVPPPSMALEQVVVTGTRLPVAASESTQPVKVYTRDQIDQSGGSTVSEFLNTLPEASLSINENGFQTLSGTTTVQLHGLPIGTTLVLLDGRRIGTSGAAQLYGLTYFDLNTIPLAAIDRIEIVSQGSSAVYGSDAIAGIVNFVLKRGFNGFEANTKVGFATGTHEGGVDVAWGEAREKGYVSVLGSYLNRTELPGYDRSLTNDSDYTRYGGPNVDLYMCPNQANIYSTDGSNLPGIGAPYAGVPSGYTGPPSQSEFVPTAGLLNRCSYLRYDSRIQATQRGSIRIEGAYKLTSAAEVYSDLLYSNVKQYGFNTPPFLYGAPGFQLFTVGPNNPFNPFGENVGVSELLPTLGRTAQDLGTNYLNAVVGLRGHMSQSWTWDVAISDSEDHSHYTQPDMNAPLVQAELNSSNPTTALNPFINAAPGSLTLLSSFVTQDYWDLLGRATVADALARGTVFDLPGGPLRFAFGGEYERDTLFQKQFIAPGPSQPTNFHRKIYAIFAEGRIPIVGPPAASSAGEMLALTLAGRYDHDDQFGSKSTPQIGVEFRPLDPLLFRASYSRAFRAPDLVDLYAANVSFPGQVADPLRGNAIEQVTITTGGNPMLQPITGLSRTVGFDYHGADPDIHVSVTHWHIEEMNGIQQLQAQVIVNNAGLFPGAVIRASSCGGASPCPITAISATYFNFGSLDVAGLDYQLTYNRRTSLGNFTPSIAVSQTYRYEASLTPASSAINAVSNARDTGDWAPRWKGTASMNWHLGDWSAYLAGRYVSHYQDYDSTQMIGNFWLIDANVRFAMGQAVAPGSREWQNLYVRIGGVNLLNRLPQFSNYLFGSLGYDPTQADIRGRFLYAQLGTRW